jgi:hypothetical protein
MIGRALCRSVLGLTAKSSHTEATVLRIALRSLRTIFIKLALVLPVQSVTLYQSYINQMLREDVKITENTKFLLATTRIWLQMNVKQSSFLKIYFAIISVNVKSWI